MGNKIDKKKSLMEMLSETIKMLEDRIIYLKSKQFERTKEVKDAGLDPDLDYEIENTKKEIRSVDNQLSYTTSAKKDFEEQLAKAKTKEEKEKLENIFKSAVLLGALNENLRMTYEQQQKEKEKEIQFSVSADHFKEKVEEIFAKNNYKYVNKEEVEEIVKNPEFITMAESDPLRFSREETEYKAEYAETMEHALRMAGIEVDEDFDVNQERMKEFFAKNNGYDAVMKFLEVNKDVFGDYMSYGTPEDQKFFKEVFEEMSKLERETKRLQRGFITGESNFATGNGYTKHLIDREQALLTKIEKYNHDLLFERMMKEYSEKGLDIPEEIGVIYKITEGMKTNIKHQIERDTVFQKNNELRKKMEMWDVYQKLPLEKKEITNGVSEKAIEEGKAWLKLRRMERLALKKGGIFGTTSKIAMEGAQYILEFVKNDDIEKADDVMKKQLKEKVAALVLNQIIYREEFLTNFSSKKKYLNRFEGLRNETEYESRAVSLVSELMKDKQFNKLFNQYFTGENIKEKYLKFIAQDMEKSFSKKLSGPNATKKKDGPKKRMNKK